MRTSDCPNKIVRAWHSGSLARPDVLARFGAVRCVLCLRSVHCWNRRIWLDDERCAHMQCFHGQFFLKALVAEEIRHSQLASDEILQKSGFEPKDLIPTDGARVSGGTIFSMATPPERSARSCISQGTRISGKVEFRELAKIEGEADGEIVGDEIDIATSAVVTAHITARKLNIGGQVVGEIIARERVELLPTARVRCTITTPTLVVTEGAQFDGDCKMPGRSTSFLQSEQDEAKETSVALITSAQKAELREQGYSDDDIALMIPAVAHRILGLK